MNIALRINRRQTSVDKCPLFLDLPTRLPDLSNMEDELVHYPYLHYQYSNTLSYIVILIHLTPTVCSVYY